MFLFKKYKLDSNGLTTVYSAELEQDVSIETALLKPVIRSGDIGRYWGKATAMVLFPYATTEDVAQLLSEKELRSAYPHGWKYLS